MTVDVAARAEPGAESAPVDRRTKWVLLGAVPLVVAYYAVQIRALGPAALTADLDIHYTLTRLTAEGSVPLIDFEHGWNTASWYWSALLYELAGGNATLWTFLWGRVTGFMLAGLVLIAVAWRLRLPPWWAGALVPAWMLVTHVPNNKYAVALLWCLTLLPVGRLARPGYAQALRVGLTATVFWFHVELAVLLGAGTAMYDAFGARGLATGERARRVLAVGAGLALGFASQAGVYALLGLGPVELARQLLFSQAETVEANFGYPLLAPSSFRTLVWPASLLLPFVPAVWRRLSEPTRFVAFLHLGQALIAIRRTDDNHIAAAATLLALLVVLVIRDLVRSPPPAWRGVPAARRALGVAGGLAWVAAALALGFRVESRAAIVGLAAACLAAVLLARAGDRPWTSAGALAGLAALLVAGVVGWTAAQVRADEGGADAAVIAEALRAEVDRCLPASRQAWVVPGPLSLYEELDLDNPTPFYVFWYTLEAEAGQVVGEIEAGRVPAVVQVGPWPPSMTGIAPAVEARLDRCATVDVDGTGHRVTVWARP